MDGKCQTLILTAIISNLFLKCEAQEFCRSMNYWCKEGHCCGRGKCCTYYYELWWFWFVWLAIAIAGICCFYQKKVKQTPFTRRFRRRHPDEPVTNAEAATNTDNPGTNSVDPAKVFSLPSYEEVKELSSEPPSYTQIYGSNISLQTTAITNLALSVEIPPEIPLEIPVEFPSPDMSLLPPRGPPAYSHGDVSHGDASDDNVSITTTSDAPPLYSNSSANLTDSENPSSNNPDTASCAQEEELSECDMTVSMDTVEEGLEAGLLENVEPIATSSNVSSR